MSVFRTVQAVLRTLAGALVAQREDGTAAGGNARGANATDWQTGRAAATQVASGDGAAIGGGTNNTASGNGSTVAGGINNAATGLRAAIGGGNNNAVGGREAWIPGGRDATTRGQGLRAAWAGGMFATQGDAQAGEFVLRRITTDATATRLTTDDGAPGTANTVNLPNNSAMMLRGTVIAYQTGGSAGGVGDTAGWEFSIAIMRGASAAITFPSSGLTLAPTHPIGAGLLAARVLVTADTTLGSLSVSVQGEANKTIRWVCRLQSVEVTA